MFGFALSHIIYNPFYSKLGHSIIQFEFSLAGIAASISFRKYAMLYKYGMLICMI